MRPFNRYMPVTDQERYRVMLGWMAAHSHRYWVI
jgi:hypothetical protein